MKMKTYILKFALLGRKFSCRMQAHSKKAAKKWANEIIYGYFGLFGGEVLSVTECPIQNVEVS